MAFTHLIPDLFCWFIIPSCSQAMADYSTALLMRGTPDVKVLVNRGLLYLQLGDHSNALMDFTEASKVHHVTLVQDTHVNGLIDLSHIPH